VKGFWLTSASPVVLLWPAAVQGLFAAPRVAEVWTWALEWSPAQPTQRATEDFTKHDELQAVGN